MQFTLPFTGVDGVISVFENTRRKLLTTRSWDFLGMHEKLKKRNAIAESNIIVGVLDTGKRTCFGVVQMGSSSTN